MMRVTLNGIMRVGLVTWKGREKWRGKSVRIWSAEHGAWWRPKAEGYTDDLRAAGIYEFADAFERTRYCGPEKRIEFMAIAPTNPHKGR